MEHIEKGRKRNFFHIFVIPKSFTADDEVQFKLVVIKDLLGQQGPQYGISLCTLKANPSEEEICSLLVTIRRIRLPNSIYQLWSSFSEASFYTANHMVFEQNNKARYLMIVPTLFDENWMPNALVIYRIYCIEKTRVGDPVCDDYIMYMWQFGFSTALATRHFQWHSYFKQKIINITTASAYS